MTGPPSEDAEAGEFGGVEDGVDVVVACLAFGLGVGGVIEFDDDEGAEGVGVADDEVDGLLGDLVDPTGPAGRGFVGAGEVEQLPEGDLGEDVAAVADDATEDLEEGRLGGGDELFVDHDGWKRGAGGGGARGAGVSGAEEVEEPAEEAAFGLGGHVWQTLRDGDRAGNQPILVRFKYYVAL